jgi:3-methylcrotonyl-CoA carboxylase alpha subunit
MCFLSCNAHFLQLKGVRYDSGIRTGSEVTMYYDSMIAKIIVFGKTRQESIQKMIQTLKETVIFGNLQNNQKFLLQVRGDFIY